MCQCNADLLGEAITMIPLVLDDIRVLDISQGISGPFCAKLLGDFGADVIKVESSDGDRGRRMPPFFQDDPHPEKSLFFLLLNLNKRGITLNLETSEGAEIFKQLVRQADIVVESFQPGYLASIGLGYEVLERENPQLIMTSITPFGQTGPYSQYQGEEIVAYATGGIMSISGTRDREPLKHGGFQAQYETGLNSFIATLYTLLLRDVTDTGQHIDVSTQEVVSSSLVNNQPYFSWMGGVEGRRTEGTMFRNVMPCKDGYFVSQAGGGASWDDIATFYGREALKEERFANGDQRVINGQAMDEIILDATKDRTMMEMFRTASEQYRMLFGIVQTPRELANCPQLEARQFFQEVEHPVIGKIKVPFRLWSMSAAAACYRRPAPLLGQHNEEVYAELCGYTVAEVGKLRDRGVI
jgi:crotonobetainyl-CoA:carnitine CoA-transferase CaiB-like acyl-CoA transferase